jgi:hypothetical protein
VTSISNGSGIIISQGRKKKNHSCVSSHFAEYKRTYSLYTDQYDKYTLIIFFFGMASQTYYEESLVERDEVLYPTSDVIDVEPLYSNFTAIQNTLRHHNEQEYTNQVSDEHEQYTTEYCH